MTLLSHSLEPKRPHVSSWRPSTILALSSVLKLNEVADIRGVDRRLIKLPAERWAAAVFTWFCCSNWSENSRTLRPGRRDTFTVLCLSCWTNPGPFLWKRHQNDHHIVLPLSFRAWKLLMWTNVLSPTRTESAHFIRSVASEAAGEG